MIKMFKRSFLVLLLCFPILVSAQQYLTYTHGGLTRDYILYVPTFVSEDAPLVFVLHGYSGTAQGIMNYSGMNDIADANNFVVCYPQGTKDNWNNNFWHVGYDFHQDETVDDVGFITALADYLQLNYDLSSENTFSTGMSNGGDMSYMLACQASGTFKAVAPVAGCMMKWIYDSCNPGYVMPIFAIHGTLDPVTWWNGDMNNSDGWGAYLSIPGAIEFWSDLNNTTGFETEVLPNIDPNDGSYVVSEKNTEGNLGHEVWLYKVVDGDHDWPGAWGNMDIDASVEIWDFFEWVIENSVIGIESPLTEEYIVAIYPNPARSFFTIELSKPEPMKYILLDINAKQLVSGTIDHKIIKIDLSEYPDGIYIIRLGTQVYKLLKSDS